ncbi:Hsp70 family protein [Caulobacter sp. SLTY]|uniref:Hsp70 family protein n=1 Tax=Caulobacter sp. SLTY TaxID=2683262 RepID=UPI0014121652|nr:Hsp70 family protein [Caulobacter sp. SLTY]NBB14044.1 Hsp70 family protein [Caulobacter sp. SLTY]
MPTQPVLGIDFGTTNTVVSITTGDGDARLIHFPKDDAEIVAFRSALSFHAPIHDPAGREVEAGPWAIETYLEEPLETRFIQSFKSYAASPLFTDTEILRKKFAFEDLLSAFLLKVRDHAGGELDDLPSRVIVGRPVNFAGLRPDPDLALRRYQEAFGRLGFTDIRYAFEPVAAAFFFARQLKQDATVLVADFGGGTSDFSLVRFEREGGRIRSQGLANSGVGVAGDAFDYRIIEHLVSPALGKGSSYRAFDNLLPIPNRYFTAFARWEQLAILRASRDMRDIRGLVRTAQEPEKIERLVEMLDDNHGYRLYQAVSRLKEALSAHEEARFLFEAGSIRLEQDVKRADFNGWIAPELAAIEGAVDEALSRAGLSETGVDRVFLTGGSSFVPAVRAIFERRFGAAKLESGAELVSIATGLALIGAEEDADLWSQRA